MDISKSDWKKFRENLPEWHEAYMEGLCREYARILSSSENASDKFWTLDERIRNDKRRKGVMCRMSKSEALYDILELIREGVISPDDLKDFSNELQTWVRDRME